MLKLKNLIWALKEGQEVHFLMPCGRRVKVEVKTIRRGDGHRVRICFSAPADVVIVPPDPGPEGVPLPPAVREEFPFVPDLG